MDYEKKYNEALKRAKAAIDIAADKDLVKGIAKTIFPELKESEDEQIRKWIVNLLHELHYNQTAQPMALKAIEWLEKQRSSTTPKWMIDFLGEHRRHFGNPMGYDERREVDGKLLCIMNWLEGHYVEQKENPKSADSIPSDCASDAKCEDRWHKVGDSLPDNPREVLCKDEAGNYFIGRYYVGEGWEISNYDDEDKPYHLNPPVSKWIDFPLEKKKESLRDFIDNFPYSDEQKERKPQSVYVDCTEHPDCPERWYETVLTKFLNFKED